MWFIAFVLPPVAGELRVLRGYCPCLSPCLRALRGECVLFFVPRRRRVSFVLHCLRTLRAPPEAGKLCASLPSCSRLWRVNFVSFVVIVPAFLRAAVVDPCCSLCLCVFVVTAPPSSAFPNPQSGALYYKDYFRPKSRTARRPVQKNRHKLPPLSALAPLPRRNAKSRTREKKFFRRKFSAKRQDLSQSARSAWRESRTRPPCLCGTAAPAVISTHSQPGAAVPHYCRQRRQDAPPPMGPGMYSL